MQLSNEQKLNQLIEQSLLELKNDYKITEGGKRGWHQFIGSSKVGNVATSQALLLIEKYQIPFTNKQHGYQFLIKEQKENASETLYGGWSYVTNLSDYSNTESTCWALQALKLEADFYQTEIQKGLLWLKRNFNKGKGDENGWGCIKGNGFRVYSTCKALSTLFQLSEEMSDEFQLGLSSLKRAQNSDGGWGDIFRGPSTLIHTSLAVITLLDTGLSPNSSQILKGIEWVIMALRSEGYTRDLLMGYVEIFDLSYQLEEKEKNQRVTFYHMPLPYAIMALIKVVSLEKELISQGVLTLMENQDHGQWKHPYLPKSQTPLWAIYDVLSLFHNFKNSPYFSSFNQNRIVSNKREKFDVIIFTVVPIEFNTLNSIFNFAATEQQADYEERGYWYYKFETTTNQGVILSCLITMVGSAGEVDCTNACHTAFNKFDCDLAILCGIAAGYEQEVAKYDSILASEIVAYEFQRWETNGKTYRPKFYSVNNDISKSIQNVSIFEKSWPPIFSDYLKLLKLDMSLLKGYNPNNSKVKTGVIASGSKLIADNKTIKILRDEIPVGKGIIALEMEGGGFAPACDEHKKKWLVIRGISDLGADDKNSKNNKKFQALAVASAAATMTWFLKYFYRVS